VFRFSILVCVFWFLILVCAFSKCFFTFANEHSLSECRLFNSPLGTDILYIFRVLFCFVLLFCSFGL
jgi:hypothetical protein